MSGVRNRLASLDGVRALAVLAVLSLHSGVAWTPGGGLGVNVFFGLSGFLITSLLLREHEVNGRIALTKFYGRRAVRLVPAFALYVVVVVGYSFARWGSEQSDVNLGAVGFVVTYAANWVRAFRGFGELGYFEHTWSLAVEEQFYLLWPIVMIVALARFGARGVLVVALAAAAGSSLLRAVLWNGGAGLYRVENGLDTVADQLLLGCAAAAVLHLVELGPRARRTAAYLGWAAFGAVAVAVVLMPEVGERGSRVAHTLGTSGLALAVAVLLVHLVTAPRGVLARALSAPPLVQLGRISYGVYLYHYLVLQLVKGFTDPGWVRMATVVAITLPLAGLSWRFAERPALDRWRSRFAAVPPSVAVVGSPAHRGVRLTADRRP